MQIGIQAEILRLHASGLLAPLLIDRTKGLAKEVAADSGIVWKHRAYHGIIWATDAYENFGSSYLRTSEMTPEAITGDHSDVIKNRARKAMEQQAGRTKSRGEVFTPRWICEKMISEADAAWFGGADPFGMLCAENQKDGKTRPERIVFPKKKKWKRYADSRRLEITCGEAPYLAQPYDVSTGEILPIAERGGILDRKLRVVSENTETEEEWLFWAFRAFEATYGYEFSGDNLLIARLSFVLTFENYLMERWHRTPTEKEYDRLLLIITWNIWQMDGLSGRIPFAEEAPPLKEQSLFDLAPALENETLFAAPPSDCKIFDWRRGNSILYRDIAKRRGEMTMGKKERNIKFDFIIGNPPYQDESNGERRNFAPPIYNLFIDSAYTIADVVELIHPARFLFNAGSTPKEWNQKMLNDPHLKVLYYEPQSVKIFANTDIKGGIAITYHNKRKDFGAIETFSVYPEINSILKKIKQKKDFTSLSEIVYSRTSYRLTDVLHKEHPDASQKLSNGHAYDMSSNIFQRLPEIFFDQKPTDGKDYIQILGRDSNSRVYKYIRKDYVNTPINLHAHKVYLAQANGSGAFGQPLSSIVIGGIDVGATESFISIGNFQNEKEAKNLESYLKTKFSRAMLSVLKVTQNGNKPVWQYVPMQDFSDKSDIDWSQSVSDIDRQLYKKYGLAEDEISFIESHVKEMK